MPSAPDHPAVTGHCLCGKVRYRAVAAPIWVAYCHCPSCRRATGSVIAPYAGYRPQDLIFDGEAPVRYAPPRTRSGNSAAPAGRRSATNPPAGRTRFTCSWARPTTWKG